MAQRRIIETYGRGSYNRNIWPHNSRATAAPSRLADSFVCPSSCGLPTTNVCFLAGLPQSLYILLCECVFPFWTITVLSLYVQVRFNLIFIKPKYLRQISV